MFIGYFTERPYQDQESGYFGSTGRDIADLGISNSEYNPEARLGPLQPLPRREGLRRGDGVRWRHAQRAPQHALLHGRRGQCRGGHPRAHYPAREDRHPRQRPPNLGRPPLAGRGARRDRHDLPRPPRHRLGARHRPRERRPQRPVALQLGALPGSARPRPRRLDPPGSLPLGRRALQLPLRESLGEDLPAAPSPDLDSRRHEPQHREVGRRAPLPVRHARHRAGAHQELLRLLHPGRRRERLRGRHPAPQLPLQGPRR